MKLIYFFLIDIALTLKINKQANKKKENVWGTKMALLFLAMLF